MFDATPEQLAAEKILRSQGFRFANWIDAQDGNESHGCMVLTRKPNRFTTIYREIAPDGSIN